MCSNYRFFSAEELRWLMRSAGFAEVRPPLAWASATAGGKPPFP